MNKKQFFALIGILAFFYLIMIVIPNLLNLNNKPIQTCTNNTYIIGIVGENGAFALDDEFTKFKLVDDCVGCYYSLVNYETMIKEDVNTNDLKNAPTRIINENLVVDIDNCCEEEVCELEWN